ncbi:MAG: dipeptidase [Ardenticatenaceae bacterium]|nr:dipeptidase [Ardenticatenaceae bacterium]
MTTYNDYLTENYDRFLQELLDFIRIPSVSALPEYAAEVQRAAAWVAARLTAAGAEHVEVMPTGGHPVVYGDWLHAGSDKPTILLYGHFDVQPADPLDLWETPAFEPTIRNGRIYARGASDDKGGMITPILAIEALLQTEGQLPVNVKFCFEGQEEIGSPQLDDFLATHKEKFAADLVLSSDGLLWAADQPMLVLGLKGLAALEIHVKAAKGDLHSGLHGGVLHNPIEALSKIIASLRTADGKIAVAGFYDDVVELSPEARAEIAKVPRDDEEYRQELGIPEFFGEPGYTTQERNWIRPTLELNGIWGGFSGAGTKTVIPSEARAKITCRLVANQDPAKIVKAIKAHIEQHTPPGVYATVVSTRSGSNPYLMAADHPGNQIAAEVLTELFGKEPYQVYVGGSIPISTYFLNHLGAYMVNFGWTVQDENLHAPNEFFRLENFKRGPVGYCQILKRLVDY